MAQHYAVISYTDNDELVIEKLCQASGWSHWWIHKGLPLGCILMAHSDVFRAMIEELMTEKNKSEVDIKNIDLVNSTKGSKAYKAQKDDL